MRDTKALPSEICGQLREMQRDLGFTQMELAGTVGVAQGTVSNCLRGKSVDRNVVSKLLASFAAQVEEGRSDGRLGEQEAREHQRVIDRALNHCRPPFDSSPSPAQPGGGMPPSAPNRVPRTVAPSILEALDFHPLSMAVDGPPMCGKTTLLLDLTEKARRRGFGEVYFDCDIANVQQSDVLPQLCTALADTLSLAWGLEPPRLSKGEPLDAAGFVRWLKARRRARPEPRGFVILDQITDLHPDSFGKLMGMLRTIHNQRGALNLSLVVARTPASREVHDWMESSCAYFHPVVPVDWFDSGEMEALLTTYPAAAAAKGRAATLLEFLGQPLLTHTALHLFEHADQMERSWRRIEDAALGLQGTFGAFARAFRPAFRDGKIREAAWRLLGEGPASEEDGETVRFLRALGFLDEGLKPRCSEFFRKVIGACAPRVEA